MPENRMIAAIPADGLHGEDVDLRAHGSLSSPAISGSGLLPNGSGGMWPFATTASRIGETEPVKATPPPDPRSLPLSAGASYGQPTHPLELAEREHVARWGVWAAGRVA